MKKWMISSESINGKVTIRAGGGTITAGQNF